MSNLILGGLITLAGSAVVQVVIVPWVTTRRRHRERWEETVIELSALIEVDIAAAAKHLTRSSKLVREVRTRLSRVTTGGFDRVGLERLEDQYNSEALATDERLTELRSQAFRLFEHAKLYHRSADYWEQLQAALLRLDLSLVLADYRSSVDMKVDSDEVTQNWELVEKCRKALVVKLKEVSDPMRPPRVRPIRRFAKHATRRLKA